MGNPVDDFERGDNCVACHAPGETPKYVMVSFTGTSHDGQFTLTQWDNCAWQYVCADPAFRVNYEIAPGVSVLAGVDAIGGWFWKQDVICQTEFNDFLGRGSAHTWFGNAPGIGAMCGSGYLVSGPGTKYEAQFLGANLFMYGIRNTRIPANILVKYQSWI